MDWNKLSSSTNINFSKELIQEYKTFWNWNLLKNNNRIIESFGDFVEEAINQSSTLTFLDKIESLNSYWGSYIYHFTHIDNAVEIIKHRKN